MNDLTEKEQTMRQYWLGILGREQSEALETEWFESDEDAELLEIARAELIDDYLVKNLSVAELSSFEKNFLPHNLDDVVLTQSSLAISREEIANVKKEFFFGRFLGGWRRFLSLPQLAAAAAILLVICAGLWFKFSGSNSAPEAARNNEAPFDSSNDSRAGSENRNNPDKTIAVDETRDDEEEGKNAKSNKTPIEPPANVSNRNAVAVKKQADEPLPIGRRQIVFLTVFRSGGLKTVSLSGEKDILTFKLTMPGIDKTYKNYRLKIYDRDGNLAVERDLGSNLSSKPSGETLTMPPLKSSLFRKNSIYKTTLTGVDENGAETELITYDGFQVKN